MVHAYDTWGVLPTMDIYDTGMMRAAVAVAKDMYDRGEQRIKDFNTTYGDFITPIQADQDWYNQNVTGKVRDTINNLYARGIDPLRSAEGRAIVAQLVNNIPVGQVAKLKSSAKAAEEYIKNRGLLEAAGKYNQDLEERFLGYNLANWDTLGGGQVWNRTSPTEMKTLKELTESWYNNRTARDLTEEDLKAAGIPYDKRYQYSGYLDSDILNVARGNTPGWNDSVYSRYYRDLAERQVAASGMPYTKQDVEARLQRNIADAQQEWLINPTKKADEFAKMAQQAAYARQLEGIRAANDKEIAQIKANGSNKDSIPGNYLHSIALKAGQVNNAFKSVLAEPRMKDLQKSIENAAKIKDPKKRDEAIKKIQLQVKNVPTRAMKDFLLRPQYGSNGKNIANIILNLTPASRGDGVSAINTILSNMAAPGDNAFNANYVLSKSGFVIDPEDKSSNPWLISDGTEKNVVTPQQLLHNIIKYESGDFQIRNVKDESHPIKKEDILAKLKDSEGNWMYDTGFKRLPGQIAQQAQRVKSDAEHGGMIVAPDENGVKHLWVKVIVGSNSFLQGDHNGYWVKSPMPYNQDNTPLSDIGVSEYASGVRESHDNTKTAVEWQQGGINW